MASRRESTREKGKGKGEKEDTATGKTEKQTKLDSMVTMINKDSNMADLITSMNSFNNKLNQLASKEYIDKSLQKLVTEEFVKQKLDELREDIKREIKAELDTVYEKVKQVKTKLAEHGTDIIELKNVTSDLQTQLDVVKEENAKLSQKNKELKDLVKDKEGKINRHDKDLNDLEQYTRRNSIRIYGVEDSDKTETSEQTRTAVITMCKNKLHVDVSVSDTDITHRLGMFRNDGNRPIICKFVSRETKCKVLRARRNLRGSSIVVREDLTIKNAKLLETVSRNEEVKRAWSDEGKIIALLENGRTVKVDLSTNLAVFPQRTN